MAFHTVSLSHWGTAITAQKKMQRSCKYGIASLSSDSRGIQTHNLLIRSQMLYSVELGSHPFRFAVAKVRIIFGTTKFSSYFFAKNCFYGPLPTSFVASGARN